jgi:hypothetical protein
MERPQKPQRGKFHGRHEAKPERPSGPPRADALTDRKGRTVPVERHGRPPPPQQPPEDRTSKQSSRHRNRRAFDRGSGARPSRPRGRR